MALDALVAVADLDARGIDISDQALITELIASASAAIRDAAGSAITETTATIKLLTPTGRRLELPGPVRSVSAVLLDEEPITDWVLRGDDLWRESWQCRGDIPGEVTVTFVFGLTEVPADVVDLACNLIGAGVNHAAEGYEAKTGIAYERIDDAGIGYTQGGDAVVSTMELPDRTRRMLARRFGGSAVMVGSRS